MVTATAKAADGESFDLMQKIEGPSGAIVTVTAPTISTSTGSTITVTLMASDTTGLGITGFNARFLFDSSVISPINSTAGCSLAGTLFAGASPTCNVFPTPDELSVQIFGLTGISGSGPIITFTFLVVGDPGDVSPFNSEGFFFNEGDPATNFVNGTVSVLSPTAAGVTLEGQVLSAHGSPVSGAAVIVYDETGRSTTARANTFGRFRLPGLRGGETYIVSAKAKNHTFPSQILTLNDQVTIVNVVAEGASRNQRR